MTANVTIVGIHQRPNDAKVACSNDRSLYGLSQRANMGSYFAFKRDYILQ